MKSIKFAPELTEQQTANLKTLENGDWPGRVRKRAEAILLSVRGYTIDEIGAITGFHRNTVSRWLDQWAERGIDGILEREGRGRKHSLSEDEERQVMEWIEENPRSANQAVGRIEESLGKIVSPDTVRRLLKRQRFRALRKSNKIESYLFIPGAHPPLLGLESAAFHHQRGRRCAATRKLVGLAHCRG